MLKIDGRLQSEDLPELERVCADDLQGLELDLSGLRGVDESAVALLRRLRTQGVRLTGVSAYVALRLGGAAE